MRPLKGLVAIASILLTVPLLFAVGLYLLLFTEPGSHWLAARATQQVPGIAWRSMRGTLAEGLRFTGLSWQGDDAGIEIDSLELAGDSSCLWRAVLCLRTVSLRDVHGWSASTDDPIRLPELWLPFTVEAPDVRVEHLRWATAADMPASKLFDSGTLDMRLSGSRLQVRRLAMTRGEDRIETEGRLRLSAPWALAARVQADIATAVNHDLVPLADRMRMDLQLEGNLGNLHGMGRFDAGFGADVEFRIQSLETSPHVEAEIRIAELPLRHAGLVWTWSAINLQADGPVDALQLQLDAHAARLVLNDTLNLPAGRLHAEAKLDNVAHTRLRYTAPEGLADLDWSGSINWRNGIWITGKLRGSIAQTQYWRADLPGHLQVETDLHGELLDDRLAVDLPSLSVSGLLRDQQVAITAALTFGLHQGALQAHLQQAAGDIGPLQVQLSGPLAPDLDLAADIALADLQSLIPELAGAARGTLRLVDSPGSPQLSFALRGERMTWQDLAADSASLQGVLHNLHAPSLQADLMLGELSGMPVQFPARSLRLRVDGSLTDLSLRVEASGTGTGLELSARLRPGDDWTQARLLSAAIHSPLLSQWQLDSPSTLAWHAATQALRADSDLCVSGAAGQLCLQTGGTLLAADASATVQIVALDPMAWQTLLPPGVVLEGRFGGVLNLAWPNGEPRVSLQLSGGPGLIRMLAGSDLPELSPSYEMLRFSAEADAMIVRSRIELQSAGLGNIHAAMELARDGESVSGNLRLEGVQLAPLRPLFPSAERLHGRIDGEFVLTGNRTRPVMQGQLRVLDARLGGAALPVEISNLHLTADLAGSQMHFQGWFDTQEGETAALAGQALAGRGRVNGNVTWEEPADWSARLQLAGEALQIQIGGHTSLEVDAGARIGLSPALLDVDGNAHIRRGRIRIQRNSVDAVPLADDVVLSPAPAVDRSTEPLPFAMIRTGLALDLGQDLAFSGFGVDGFLTGKLRLADLHTQRPRAVGRIDVINGRYRAYGQRLRLRRGRLDFRGDLQEPFLDVEAVRKLESVVAGVRVRGSAVSPELRLFSEPAMPEEDILSWLVLGKPLGSGTAQDNAALSSALLGVGLRGGEAAGERLAEKLGITGFEVGTAGNGADSEVYASGYVSPRLFIRYGVAGLEAANTLKLRYGLLPQLFLEATSGVETAVDLLYSIEF